MIERENAANCRTTENEAAESNGQNKGKEPELRTESLVNLEFFETYGHWMVVARRERKQNKIKMAKLQRLKI